MGVKVTGLGDVQRRLRELQHRAESLSGEHQVQLSDLFTSEFMLLNTDFESIDALFEASGYNVKSQDDLDSIPIEPFDAFVRSRTRFASWDDMKGAAAQNYMAKRLFGEG
jgi:hypothetical protein